MKMTNRCIYWHHLNRIFFNGFNLHNFCSEFYIIFTKFHIILMKNHTFLFIFLFFHIYFWCIHYPGLLKQFHIVLFIHPAMFNRNNAIAFFHNEIVCFQIWHAFKSNAKFALVFFKHSHCVNKFDRLKRTKYDFINFFA